ncbi:winged helix-turn-helix domain-containing protein [Microlunatus flavus]|uniref:winged helix-turn-helix domain-containing protein n=1 Tax=Microlunatus flavus TaxID=1036181 RepID=UPI001E343C7D|nr:crosslink repair DNA glycosylase YcaQ family protein [Microlunatus flavus]
MPTDSSRPERLSPALARRVVLAAQGFGRPALERPVGMRDVAGLARRLGQFQIDSINVVTRAHFVPTFSRLGPYDPALLERAAFAAPRRLFEYWGHAASLLDVELEPLLRFRMNEGAHSWGGVDRVARANPALVEHVRREVADRGPVSARQLEVEEAGRDRSRWGWNWSAVKTVLEWLFYLGEVSSAYRNSQFERVYDLPDRVLPAEVRARPTPSEEESVRGLVRRAALALGVATEPALRDYFRTRPAATQQAVAELVESGELRPVQVGDQVRPWYLWHEARLPRRVHARAVLSPFDSLVFERARLEALFDFAYRIEIYVPEPKRAYGYYVYPFLLGDRFVARVDLKADRARGVLRVVSAWAEDPAVHGRETVEVAEELAAELASMAAWQGLSGVEVLPRGDLAPALALAVRGS